MLNTLKVADRCDRCGAQAFVWARFTDEGLLFCGHHFARWETAIRASARFVLDERHRINPEPSQSANV